MVSVLTLVFAFRSSAALAYAFGMAVTGPSPSRRAVPLHRPNAVATPLWLVVIGGGALLLVDLLFLAANLTKLVHGAWLPLLIGLIAFTVMTTWRRGTRDRHPRARERRRTAGESSTRSPATDAAAPGPRHGDIPQPRKADRAAGDAGERRAQPRAHEHVVIVAIETCRCLAYRTPSGWKSTPRLCQGRDHPRHRHASGTWKPRHPRRLRLLDPTQTEGPNPRRASYFLSKIELTKGRHRRWRHGASACSSPPPHHLRRRRVLRPAPRAHGASWVRELKSRFGWDRSSNSLSVAATIGQHRWWSRSYVRRGSCGVRVVGRL